MGPFETLTIVVDWCSNAEYAQGMKSSAFIKIIADAYRVEEKSVTLYARMMKEAGLITSGSRGPQAPHMHPRDAVRLTLALLATSTAAHAVDKYQRFAKMTFQPERSNGPIPDSFGLQDGITLEALLLHLFTTEMFHDGPPHSGPFGCFPYLELQVNARTATIEYTPLIDGALKHDVRNVVLFKTSERSPDERATDAKELFGIRVARGLASAELLDVAVPFHVERRDRVSWETMRKETEAELEQRIRYRNFKPEKGLWFERDIEGGN